MAAEYSYPLVQTIAEDENVIFLDGDRACRKGYITHRSGSGVFRLKGAGNACKTVYRVTFNANIAVSAAADGGVGDIAVDGLVDRIGEHAPETVGGAGDLVGGHGVGVVGIVDGVVVPDRSSRPHVASAVRSAVRHAR